MSPKTTRTPPTELVVLSHLRWPWVWQRPQHLISRLAAGRRTWFVEEPVGADVPEPRLGREDLGAVQRVWLEVPGDQERLDFTDVRASSYGAELSKLLGRRRGRAVWLYTPMALDLVEPLRPDVLVYDVMDDLASFKDAAPELQLRQRQSLRQADLVFTGGKSLDAGVRTMRTKDVHLFPSGVDPEHYAAAIPRRRQRRRPVAGYVGVIDERLDLGLIADLATHLPDWDIQMVGPVAKIAPSALPRAANLHWLGPRTYDELPAVMAGFDVALMPFALNEATRSISPTKTLEYLAAGLPVVSTRVPDVVSNYGTCVDLQETSAGFADACRRVVHHDRAERAASAQPLLDPQRWDTIASAMEELIAACFVTDAAAVASSQEASA